MSAWPNVRLGEVIRHRKGSITIDDATTYKLCRVQLHRRGVVLREHRAGAEIRTKKQQVCRAGDFLVAEMDAKVGGYGFVPPDLDGAIVSTHYFLFELDEARLWPGFLEVVSQAEILQRQIVAKGSTNYAAIRPASVLGWEIPLPPLAVQKRMAANFTRARAALTNAEREIAHQEDLVAKLKQAILQEAITGRLTAGWRAEQTEVEPASQLLARIRAEKARLVAAKKLRPEKPLPPIPDSEIPFTLPEGWAWCRLGAVGSSTRGKTPKYAPESERVILNQKCVRWGSIELRHAKPVVSSLYSGSDAEILTRVDDLLVNSTGEGTIGRSSVVNEEAAGYLYDTHVLCFRPTSQEAVSATYLMLLINSQCGQVQINVAKGAQTTKQTELGTRNLNNLLIPLPPLSEQTEIVARVEGLMERCRELEAEIARSRAHAADLLQAVLREAFAPATVAA